MAVFTFGPYRLDATARRLLCGGEPVPISERQLEVLLDLVRHPGEVRSKDQLIAAGWGDVAVTDNSLEQAVSALRRALALHPPDEPLIQTVPRRGYRFATDVAREAPRATDERLDALLAPHRAWLEGRAALETLALQQVGAAEAAFRRALAMAPDSAPVHVGMAHARAFRFESTRIDTVPDTGALADAVRHAREACRLDPQRAEAWAVLGLALHRAGFAQDGLAAARRAVSLEPGNWRHHLRLALVTWGEERLGAASQTLQMLPGLALAHFLAATVHVARQAFELAERELDAGAAAQDEQLGPATGRPRFAAVGLHWLRGLVRLRGGDAAGARTAFERELAFESLGHLYARECCAQVHYALGAVACRGGDLEGGVRHFETALAYAGGHVMALAAANALGSSGEAGATPLELRCAALQTAGFGIDAAAAAALPYVLRGDSRTAAATLERAIASAEPGAQGWSLPVDPMLRMGDNPAVWSRVLALLLGRAA